MIKVEPMKNSPETFDQRVGSSYLIGGPKLMKWGPGASGSYVVTIREELSEKETKIEVSVSHWILGDAIHFTEPAVLDCLIATKWLLPDTSTDG